MICSLLSNYLFTCLLYMCDMFVPSDCELLRTAILSQLSYGSLDLACHVAKCLAHNICLIYVWLVDGWREILWKWSRGRNRIHLLPLLSFWVLTSVSWYSMHACYTTRLKLKLKRKGVEADVFCFFL